MKDTIIVVEGPQGAGKTTFTNYLREKMSGTDLYRLAGIKDKTETGHKKIEKKYLKLIEYIENCEDVNLVFDRTFFTEEIYGRLGFKPYSFTETYNMLLQKFDNLNFNIYLVVLYLGDTSVFEKRIKRDKHEYQAFNAQSSIKQQNEYLKLADEVEKSTKNIKVIRFNSDNSDTFTKQIDDTFGHLFK